MKRYLCALLLTTILTSETSGELRNAPKKTLTNSQDLLAQAKAEMEHLTKIVQNAISSGLDSVDILIKESNSNRKNLTTAVETQLDRQYDVLWNRLSTVKQLAYINRANIGECLAHNEAVILDLPRQCGQNFSLCVIPSINQLQTIQESSGMSIAIVIKQLEPLASQLDLCNGEDACILRTKAEIILSKITIPEQIKNQVNRASEQVETIKVLDEDCMDVALSYLIGTGANLIDDIVKCVQTVLSSI